jgi:cytidine deaminase
VGDKNLEQPVDADGSIRPSASPEHVKNKKVEHVAESRDPLNPLAYPELVFGIVGPAGTDLPLVISFLRKELQNVGYAVEEIGLSKLIEGFFSHDYSADYEDDRISKLMKDGTELREESKRGDAVALLGIAEIRRRRKLRNQDKDNAQRTAYILRSLKHPHEIETLKNIYGTGFFTISAYSPREARVDALAERIAKSRHLPNNGGRASAEALIEKDESENGKALGQDVKDAFPLADLFVDCRSKTSLRANMKRFVELLFSHPYHTPSKDEYGMFHAKSAALRSADLGRQVGAVIATKESDIIAVGCNDVPKASGGLYWPDDKGDARDFQIGMDSMYEQREQILSEILEKFKSAGLLSEKLQKDNGTKKLVYSLISGEKKGLLKNTQVMNLLEFGRSVHAEMAALMDAARRGVSVKGATLYCTTFPCHLCARHIIAAGIDRVVYIEPYPKSRAKQLHSDSISVDSKEPVPGKVNFEPFTGIAPRQYLQIFEMQGERKEPTGKIIDLSKGLDKPRVVRFRNTHVDIEAKIVAEVIPRLQQSLGQSSDIFKSGENNE